uniref:Uncharacterized protein n=1 Tax=Oryza punctata TaxID=4537 RepID=A0A0E0MAS8_ORYPU
MAAMEPKSTSPPRRFDLMAKGQIVISAASTLHRDDDALAQQPEVDAQSAAEEEEFQSSANEREEEENIPYANSSSDHELDEVGDNDNE